MKNKLSETTKQQLKQLFELAKKLETSGECSGVCDSYGICSVCSVKSNLDNITTWEDSEELR